MNPPTAGLWNNPPPPGIDDDEPQVSQSPGLPEKADKDSGPRWRSRSRSLDRRRSRDRSRDRRKRHRSRSRSRGRHRRSRSRRRTRSHSRSSSRDRYRRRRRHKRSRSRRRSTSSTRSHRHRRTKRHSREERSESPRPPNTDNEELQDMTIEEEEVEPPKENAFKNDGTFLEMFKKMQEEQTKAQEAKSSEARRALPAFGKRRGGRVLKTGLVQKTKVAAPVETSEPQDAWSVYLKEVKRYKEACCDDDSKTRPLVK